HLLRPYCCALSLPDALPILSFAAPPTANAEFCGRKAVARRRSQRSSSGEARSAAFEFERRRTGRRSRPSGTPRQQRPSVQVEHRSEEHTSELQSRFDTVCRL